MVFKNYVKNDRFENKRLKNELSKKRSFWKTIVSFSFFVVVCITKRSFFKKNENVNIPIHNGTL